MTIRSGSALRVGLGGTLLLPVVLLVLLHAIVIARAQPLPPSSDPGVIQRQLEERQEQRAPGSEDAGPETGVPEPPDLGLPEVPGLRFLLREVVFTPSAFLTAAELQAIASQFVGREVSFDDIDDMLDLINARYEAQGIFTALAVVRPQSVSDGRLTITLVEGRLGRLTIEGNRALKDRFIKARVRLPAGEVIDVRELDRQIGLFNRTNAARVRASLAPGAEVGLSDVTLTVDEPGAIELEATVDNFGFASTGTFEYSAKAQFHTYFLQSDRTTLFFLQSEGSMTASVAYNFAVGRTGTRIGVSDVAGQTEIVNGLLAPLDVTGWSNTVTVDFSDPILDSANPFFLALARYRWTLSKSEISGVQIGDLTAHQFDFGARLSRTFTMGALSFESRAAYVLADERATGVDNDFFFMEGQFSYFRNMNPGWRFSVDFDWQWAPEKFLPGTFQFQVGGTESVRGYAPGTAAADNGYATRLELVRDLRVPLPNIVFSDKILNLDQADLFVFYDRAQLSSPFPTVTLNAVGLGFRMNRGDHFIGRIELGVPINTRKFPDTDPVQFFGSLTVKI